MIGSWDFLQNPHLALNSSLYWSLLCLLLLVGCGVGYSIAKELNRKRTKDVFWTPKERLLATVTNIAERASMIALGAILGTFGGIGYRDHQLIKSQITYTSVFVKAKITERRFVMQPEWMKPIDSELCAGPPVDWREGETLADWTFEQKQGCKRVISYHKKPQGELNVSLR